MKLYSSKYKKLLIFFLKKMSFLYFRKELPKPEKQKFLIFQKKICEVSTAARENPCEVSTAARENPCEVNAAASYQGKLRES